MVPRSDLFPLERNAWLLEIGRRIRADYDALKEPVPIRLAFLIREFERRCESNAVSASDPEGDVD
jgi:hypothetical protein